MFEVGINNNQKVAFTPLGEKPYQDERELRSIEQSVEAEMAKRLKRAPTTQELRFGPKANDDRTPEQVAERKAWKPKRPAPDPLEVMADKLEPPNDPYYSVADRNKRLATGLRGIAERNRSTVEDSAKQQDKLARLKHDLAKIDNAIEAEHWRAERGSARLVDVLSMLREQLVDGSDSAETKRLRAEYQRLTSERAKAENATYEAEKAEWLANAPVPPANLATVGEEDPIRYRANELMSQGSDPTSAWTQARSEAEQE